MASRLTEAFMDEVCQAIQKYKDEGIAYEKTTGVSQAKRFIILKLVNSGVPFKVLNQGCGVSTITTKTDVCPKCKGTGRI
jgi:uncharacterized protein YerC